MKLDALTPVDLEEVHRIYEKNCGDAKLRFEYRFGKSSKEFIEELRREGSDTHRVGSRWSTNSKVVVLIRGNDDVNFSFEDCIASGDTSNFDRQAALTAGRNFEEEVNAYFVSLEQASRRST